MPDEHDLVAAKACQATANRLVVAEAPVAVDLAEFAANHLDVVFEERPLRMPRHLDNLPGGEILIGFAEKGGVVVAELTEFTGVVELLLGLERLQFLNLLFELGQGFLKLQQVPEGRWAILAGELRCFQGRYSFRHKANRPS